MAATATYCWVKLESTNKVEQIHLNKMNSKNCKEILRQIFQQEAGTDILYQGNDISYKHSIHITQK